MSNLWNLVKKELKELLTPTSLISVIIVTVLFIAMGSFIGGESQDATALQRIGYVDLSEKDAGVDYADFGIKGIKEYYGSQADLVIKLDITAVYDANDHAAFDEELYHKMVDNQIDTAIVIMKGFNTNLNAAKMDYGRVSVYWNQTSLGMFSAISSVTWEMARSSFNGAITDEILKNDTPLTENNRQVAMTPSITGVNDCSTFLKGTIHQGVTPADVYNAMSKQTMFVPIIIMLIIVMIGSIVISSMGNEKENKTLETLLTLPVNRTTIVAGKLIGSTIAGLVMGVLYMIGMYFYINGFAGSDTGNTVTLESLGLSLSVVDWLIVTAFMFLSIVCALGICMILGALAKNYKAAQTYIMPISILAIIPMFVTMFSSIDSLPAFAQVLLFAIPFTHPMVIMQDLMFGNTVWIVGGAIYLVVFTVVTFYLTVKIYNSDILITGLSRKHKKKPLEEEKEDVIE